MARVGYGLEVGSIVGGYRVDELLGRGGMGMVYAATHTRLGRRAALKILSPDLADDAEFRERFIRESRHAASLEHPSVIPIYGADEDGDLLYLAMRYVDGPDLGRLLTRDGPISLEQTLKIASAVAAALDEAHARGLIHRDVKPANILVESKTGHVFLTDFGLAKLLAATGFTRTGSFLGTVHYCAPEQIESKQVDGRADVYSLGCVLFHCLTGQPPYPRESDIAVIHAHIADPIPAVTTLRPDLPRYLDGVFATAMAKFPDVRYGTGKELVEALRTGDVGRVTVQTSPPTPAPTVLEPVPIPVSPPTGATVVKRDRRPAWLLFAALGLVAAAGAAAMLVVTASSKSSAAPETTVQSTTSQQPPAPAPLAAVVGRRMGTALIPPQQRLTNLVRAASATGASFGAMEEAAGALRSSVLETQGWAAAGLVVHSGPDAAVKRLFSKALAAQAAYAEYVQSLPPTPAAFTHAMAVRTIALANGGEEAYARLAGAAPGLATMPLYRSDHVHLLNLVPKPKRVPRPTVNPGDSFTPSPRVPGPSDSATNAALANTIREHWQAINVGDYERAYSFFSPHLQSQQARSNWIQDKLVDRPQSSVIAIHSISVQGGTAYVGVSFRTIGEERSTDNSGCNGWEIEYRLVEIGGAWYLDKSSMIGSGRTSYDCAGFTL